MASTHCGMNVTGRLPAAVRGTGRGVGRPAGEPGLPFGIVIGGRVELVVGLEVGLAVDLTALTHAARVEADDVEPGARFLRKDQRAQLVQGADTSPARAAGVEEQGTDPLSWVASGQPGQREVDGRPGRVSVVERNGEAGAFPTAPNHAGR